MDMTNFRKNVMGNMGIKSTEQKMSNIACGMKIYGCIDLMTEPRIFDDIGFFISPYISNFLNVMRNEKSECQEEGNNKVHD
jgi:hypothetical protein